MFDNLKVGEDVNNDKDLDDAGDNLVVNENFGNTSVTASHDKAGNLVDDGDFIYVYDAPALDSRLRQRELTAPPENCRSDCRSSCGECIRS